MLLSDALSERPAIVAISEGDLALWKGERAQAVDAWRQALGQGDAAAEVMARVRLLQVSGNFGPFLHEGPLYRALSDCPEVDPWCAVARADYHLFMPAFTGADPGLVPSLVADSPLPGPAAARQVLAGAPLTVLSEFESTELDGMGQGMRLTGRARPPLPGTWVLGLGVYGAPGDGYGGSLRFFHPDVGWHQHQLSLSLGGDSFGQGYVASTFSVHAGPRFQALAARDWLESGAPLDTLRGSAGPTWGGRVWTAAETRWDHWEGAWLDNHGLLVTAVIGRQPRLNLMGRAGAGDYLHAEASADLLLSPTLGATVLAMRVGGQGVFTNETPFFRWPTAGGASLLRGLPAASYRDRALGVAQLEARQPLVGPLWGALFIDTAWITGPHLTAGGGLRLVLPPTGMNTTRVDVGFGEGRWGVIVAWGEAF